MLLHFTSDLHAVFNWQCCLTLFNEAHWLALKENQGERQKIKINIDKEAERGKKAREDEKHIAFLWENLTKLGDSSESFTHSQPKLISLPRSRQAAHLRVCQRGKQHRHSSRTISLFILTETVGTSCSFLMQMRKCAASLSQANAAGDNNPVGRSNKQRETRLDWG